MSKFRGTYNPDGSIAEYPDRDIFNNGYEKPATYYRLDKSNQFVVLPPHFADYEHVFTLLAEAEARDREIEKQAQAEYQQNNKEAIEREEQARRAILGSAPAPSVVAPVMIEGEAPVRIAPKGRVTPDADA